MVVRDEWRIQGASSRCPSGCPEVRLSNFCHQKVRETTRIDGLHLNGSKDTLVNDVSGSLLVRLDVFRDLWFVQPDRTTAVRPSRTFELDGSLRPAVISRIS